MLFFLSSLSDHFSFLNIFRYITFRTAGALVTASFIIFVFGPRMIRALRSQQGKGQPIRVDILKNHSIKTGTPTMGGVMILFSILLSSLIWCNITSFYVHIVFFIVIGFGLIGFWDDYLKVTKQSSTGFAKKSRLFFEFLIAGLGVFFLVYHQSSELSTVLTFPFFKSFFFNLSWFFIPFASFVIVGSANAVNLTDGLDGLAIVPVMIAAASFGMIAYLSGNFIFAEYLQIHFVPGTGELAVILGAVVGAGLGFLWFNAPPAAIFMGDTGSLALGALIGSVSVCTKHEIVMAIIGGLFVMEAVSVIIQVFFFKITGRRVFLMAPIHHHFEKLGWTESQIVIRFWIISVMLALLGLSTLKLR